MDTVTTANHKFEQPHFASFWAVFVPWLALCWTTFMHQHFLCSIIWISIYLLITAKWPMILVRGRLWVVRLVGVSIVCCGLSVGAWNVYWHFEYFHSTILKVLRKYYDYQQGFSSIIGRPEFQAILLIGLGIVGGIFLVSSCMWKLSAGADNKVGGGCSGTISIGSPTMPVWTISQDAITGILKQLIENRQGVSETELTTLKQNIFEQLASLQADCRRH